MAKNIFLFALMLNLLNILNAQKKFINISAVVKDSLLHQIIADQESLKYKLSDVNTKLQYVNKEISVKCEGENNNASIITAIVSILAIIFAYLGVRMQTKSIERTQINLQNREWCYQLINYISEYLNEIEKQKALIHSTIMKGKPVSETQSILEIKIELQLDNAIEEEKLLLNTIKEYRASRDLQNFTIQGWMERIKVRTHSVINNKWV